MKKKNKIPPLGTTMAILVRIVNTGNYPIDNWGKEKELFLTGYFPVEEQLDKILEKHTKGIRDEIWGIK